MIARFWEELARLDGTPCRLLECGSRRQAGQPPGVGSHAKEHRADVELVGLDAEPGEGVRIVGDLHDLSGVAAASFDAVLICSVLEHVRRPWVVAEQLARVTRPGGALYVQTHLAFPLHDYPRDYYRFTTAGLAEVFAPAGWKEVISSYEFEAAVVPLENYFTHARDWNFHAAARSWLNVWGLYRRE